eukprot:CAMPEP_0172488048 /NCGR_PEP_ID=MMETSP1066-20121228/17402_1 /TAXON_ID=671091 /ORGANISM="Coscinodiscus wailesii, Strain CCMP2513" /LENGTH=223 /DNA_ID=CAMNT_0013255029 /DNA_START=205 /DNA_END=876 /DNA_ORIENTATION=+
MNNILRTVSKNRITKQLEPYHSRRQQQQQPHARTLSSSSSSITKNLSSWERSAQNVKNTDNTDKYLEHIRRTHDPALHVKTLEDELRGTMGKALGKQGDKVMRFLILMERERARYEELVSEMRDNGTVTCHIATAAVKESAERYNGYRKDAMTARWELIVHRQAIGFIVDNHAYVTSKYPIGEALPLHCNDVDEEKTGETKESRDEVNHLGQLDWWQRVGRWR